MWVALAVVGCTGDTTDTTPVPVPTGTTGDTGVDQVTDLIEQDLVGAVDILWVMDATWVVGMSQTEAAMDTIEETLLLHDPDWRMGVLDASTNGPEFGLIGAKWETWPTPTQAFDLATPAVSRPRDVLYAALEQRIGSDQNSSFLEGGADLFAIVVTDGADESGLGGGTEQDFQTWFTALEPTGRERLAVVTINQREDEWAPWVIDAPLSIPGDFTQELNDLVLEAIGLTRTFALSQVPSRPPRTVDVIYRDHGTTYNLRRDYTYDDVTNSITFKEFVPKAGSIVRIQYRLPSDEDTGTTTE